MQPSSASRRGPCSPRCDEVADVPLDSGTLLQLQRRIMADNTEFMRELIAAYGPQLPTEQLVVRLNKLFHGLDAADYDKGHPEIAERLPTVWREMIDVATTESVRKQWQILDFGCGTGFEATQLLQNIPQTRLAGLTCYDPSPEMLAICRTKISPLFPDAVFTSSWE